VKIPGEIPASDICLKYPWRNTILYKRTRKISEHAPVLWSSFSSVQRQELLYRDRAEDIDVNPSYLRLCDRILT